VYSHKSSNIRRNRKIYGNWKVQSPDDILMFRCNEKKANWYLDRGLGELVDKSTVRLNFKPNGLGNHNKVFGLSEMVNRCIVCGTDEFLTRHHVVPYSYRRFFPLEMKSHKFHDILSVCANCHTEYEKHADVLKQTLAIKYDAPINGEFECNRDDFKYSRISSTLLGECSSIPKWRIGQLRDEVKSHYNIKRLTNNRLLRISNIKSIVIKKTHGQLVVEKLTDIKLFVEMWREHFIKSMDCKYLPINWSIKNEI
jgi:exonuclease 3'-5' domain-containing protein 2